MAKITAKRYHDISCGHRVAGHENKCAMLHGHNYRVTFTCEAVAGALDPLGRVIDFSVIKERLCMWLECNWDHRFLAWIGDDRMRELTDLLPGCSGRDMLFDSIVWTPFNPTAENMANFLLREVGPNQLAGTGVHLIKVEVEETRKCSAEAYDGEMP